MVYMIMKHVAKVHFDPAGGYTSIDKWYVVQDDGSLVEFKTPEWNGLSRTERRAIKEEAPQ